MWILVHCIVRLHCSPLNKTHNDDIYNSAVGRYVFVLLALACVDAFVVESLVFVSYRPHVAFL